MKKEYGKLHDRYSELFKTHLDYMERTKAVLGPERLDAMQQGGGAYASMRPKIAGMALNQLNRSSGPVSFGYSELEHNAQSIMSADIGAQTTPSVERPPVSLKSELKVSSQTRPEWRQWYENVPTFVFQVPPTPSNESKGQDDAESVTTPTPQVSSSTSSSNETNAKSNEISKPPSTCTCSTKESVTASTDQEQNLAASELSTLHNN